MLPNEVRENLAVVVDAVVDVYEHIMESHTRANILIVTLIVLAALPLLGVGIVTTRAVAPIQAFIER